MIDFPVICVTIPHILTMYRLFEDSKAYGSYGMMVCIYLVDRDQEIFNQSLVLPGCKTGQSRWRR